MTTYYCTTADVAEFIWRAGTGDDFTETTTPRKSAVEKLINRAEGTIDSKTHHAWRTTSVSNEYYDVRETFWHQRLLLREIPLYLKHRYIHTFTSGTHKIEIWDGSSWNDLVSGNYTEGRDADYWIDYNEGIIFFCDTKPYYRKNGVRVTYDYGESSVPDDIKQACIMMVAISLAYQDDRSLLFPEGTSNIPLSDKVEKWQAEVNQILEKRTEHRLIY